jgi:hypothetical protein
MTQSRLSIDATTLANHEEINVSQNVFLLAAVQKEATAMYNIPCISRSFKMLNHEFQLMLL